MTRNNIKHLQGFNDEELVEELELRDYFIAKDIQGAIKIIEQYGYYVTPENIKQEFLLEIYDHCKDNNTQEFIKWLDKLFIKELEMWL